MLICRYCNIRLSSDECGEAVCEGCLVKAPTERRRATAPVTGRDLPTRASQEGWSYACANFALFVLMLGLLTAAVLIAAPFLF